MSPKGGATGRRHRDARARFATDEVLVDDAHGLLETAKRSNVDAALEIWPGMIHVWHMFHAMLPEGGQAIESLVQFVLARWNAVKS